MKKVIFLFFLVLSLLNSYSIGPKDYNSAINSKKIVIVQFWAPWCGICKALQPEYAKAKNALASNSDILFVEYNYDKAPDFAEKFNIEGLPTMILYKNGQEVSRLMADASKEEILDWIDINK